ncbi:hypothetical protein MLD38_024649 [Melastoma candidum]|uniref:Uncharacterized protein n=1 Tax=Melastoma candidum TaxID=119954 RepID=A0ACB9NZR8_9MYRT|nr:hypothetical protein MLD38_024649 [Melastoma candidum]
MASNRPTSSSDHATATATLVGKIDFGCVRQQQPRAGLGFRSAAAEFLLAPGRIATGKQLPGTGGLRLRDPVALDEAVPAKENILACPVCYQGLTLIGQPISVSVTFPECWSFVVGTEDIPGNEMHMELIAASGLKEYAESTSMTTEFFRFPLISYVYERGWRQGFSAVIGFPGPEREFEMMKGYLQPVLGGNIVYASCGSGQFTGFLLRAGYFLKSLRWTTQNMLKECYEFIQKEEGCPKEYCFHICVWLVRVDISRLPFATGSIDAVHAGAVIHCWPSPSSGVAENMYQIWGSQIFVPEGELEDPWRLCGLTVVKCVRNRRFVMGAATKPT